MVGTFDGLLLAAFLPEGCFSGVILPGVQFPLVFWFLLVSEVLVGWSIGLFFLLVLAFFVGVKSTSGTAHVSISLDNHIAKEALIEMEPKDFAAALDCLQEKPRDLSIDVKERAQ